MNLIIDIGNTRTKLVAFQDGTPTEECIAEGSDLGGLADFVKKYPFKAAILCSTVDLGTAAEQHLAALPCPLLRFTPATPTPLQNRYRSPQTLGSDRLAAAVGAWTLRPGRNLLIIDAGSCITFDLVTADGAYLGGNISPGLHARLRAIDDYFPRLPLVEAEGPTPELGYDTETAIRAGVIEGMRHEIEGYIRHFNVKYDGLLVFLTGGDQLNFDKTIKSAIFADHFMVPRGLDAILAYNMQ
ncbi:MAG: type III pantothenate kinase [Bacteroidaceae bacterium]|nr:type III pantothenate kinase [Bacteroidaceae bacterium]